jgi:hypothetical protein
LKVVDSKNVGFSRREFLSAGAGAALAAGNSFSATAHSSALPALKPEERQFLEDYSKRSFRFFWDQWSQHTGLFLDRGHMDGSASGNNVGSVAATGFGLSALAIGADHGWVSKEQARIRALTTLRFLWAHAFHDHGWFYHFMDASSGTRAMGSEVSSIDTALLLAGVLTVQSYFSADREIRALAKQIFERVDFVWMLNGSPLILSHGFRPGSGFIDFRWTAYCEASILYLLAIGSPRHAIPADSWYAWLRPQVVYEKWKFVSGGPLFTHQYAHAWVDFRHQKDGDPFFLDYFENSQMATYAHRDFCISLQSKYGDYGPNMWGITVSDSPTGYMNWGATTASSHINGTLVPCAAAGSLMFAPEICLPVLREMYNVYGDKIYQRYGFTDAFNPNWKDEKLWVNQDVVGIDVGITLLSIENLLSGNVWRWFMRNQYIQTAMERVGFRLSTPGVGIRETRTGARRG